MENLRALAVILSLCIRNCHGIHVYPRMQLAARSGYAAGDPLFLTPYIERGDVELARNISQVTVTEQIGITSHSGFITVNKKYNSNLFFWYFPSKYNVETAPVVLWLQGGPGASSLLGLFVENGPIVVTENGLTARKYHWALENNLIYIDNPVGSGFSFTGEDDGYCDDEACVARDLYNCLQQFFDLFPQLRSREFYVTGESYAGKYIPSLAMEIHDQNQQNDKKINLRGLAMGNAYCDPINQIDYGNYLYQHGLLDDKQRELFLRQQQEIIDETKAENWVEAGILLDRLIDGALTNFSYFRNYTGFQTYYNFLKTNDDVDVPLFLKMLDNDATRRSVHVGNLSFNTEAQLVQVHLAADMLQSVAPMISALLDSYRILIYNGQLDIIVAYPLTENFLRHLKFSSAEEYEVAPRKIWRVNDDIAGYYKKAGNLIEVMVRNAGHMVPMDQPLWSLDLITNFIKNKI
ncbi:venom serine carboxypeptidase-like [Aricia agestis]|uniref:venom serine carboxypeptidase-like n=1 Tax=Aricia agestis TaxID=91739 RepID=UPI001C20BE89|nr:venom serine carboxypeptidase-like [Aricia agestis]